MFSSNLKNVKKEIKRKNTIFEDNSTGLNHQVLLCKHYLYGERPHTQQARKCV